MSWVCDIGDFWSRLRLTSWDLSDALEPFRDPREAAWLLSGCAEDIFSRMQLRNLLDAELGVCTSGMSDEQVVSEIAHRVSSGQIRVVRLLDPLPVPPLEPPAKRPPRPTPRESKPTWIEIVLLDEDGKPIGGEQYEILAPDGQTTRRGKLDDRGLVRVDGIIPGRCRVRFPALDDHGDY